MVNQWITEDQSQPSSDFDEFLGIYKALLDGKTSDLSRLKVRIRKMWESFPMDKKKDYTGRMVNSGLLEQNVVSAIRIFNGIITEII